LPTFSLQAEGAKKKFTKRNAVRGISPTAVGDESSALDSQTFEKSLIKTFLKVLLMIVAHVLIISTCESIPRGLIDDAVWL